MTHRVDVADGRDIVARWCNLAEQRLEYLTELFETGRWRRYHSELAFLENIQEAKTAVETWRSLSAREASFDNSAIDMSWLGRRVPPPRRETVRDQAASPQPLKILDEPPLSAVPALVEGDVVCAEDAPSVVAMQNAPEPTLDIAAIEQRYPLLRNAL
ncbi:TIGR03809 family protein [Bradyrhizobium sediminis]|uniref:TIGR03809 family protein n=1 Tax=Bradyrhizobium sediminis TaxID=2840469 RepID=A0A975RUJ7_9BRAD|nr:TIGR03809 family protein [Bradyrhizobium sediminis]QWG20113.1 TIGR03809 family protein [Bradyrhizobium sediminis]